MSKTPSTLSRDAADRPAAPSALVTIGRRVETRMVALAIVMALGLSLLSPVFLTRMNVITILDQSVVIGTLAVGMTAVVLTGGIDLSVGAVVGLTGMILGLALPHVGIPLAVVLALASGAGIGLLSGLVIALGRVAPFIVTLGMMALGHSLAGLVSGGVPLSGLPEGMQALVDTRLGGVPVNVVFLLALYLAAWAFLTYTKGGRTLFAIGSNKAAARAAGLRIGLYAVLPYVLSGLLAGVAASFAIGRLLFVDPAMGTGLELDVIAAVVIGGTSLSGGRGSVVGTLLGVLVVVMLRNGLALLGLSSFWQGAAVGAIILVAPLLERIAAWRAGR